MKVHEFEVGKHSSESTWARPGKPEHQDAVTLVLERRRAFQLLQRLAQELSDERPGEIEIMLFGELRESAKD